MGAKATAGLCQKGALTRKQGERLLCFTINSSPAFIIGAVGTGLLRSANTGVLLYAAHLGASLLVGAVTARFAPRPRPGRQRPTGIKSLPVADGFVAGVTDSARSILYICGFVVLFSTVISLLNSAGFFPGAAAAIGRILPAPGGDPLFYQKALVGLFEVSNGCAAAVSVKGMPALLLISGCLSWSGLSVQFQVMSAIRPAGLSVRLFILTRALHLLFALALTFLLFTLVPVALPAFAPGAVLPVAQFHTAPASAALLVLCALLLLSLVTV